jgi:hypothetical protein
MQKQPYANLTLDELKSREKMLKTAVSLITASILVMTIAGAFITYKQGFSVFTVLPIVFISIVLINLANLKKVRAEIAAREQ